MIEEFVEKNWDNIMKKLNEENKGLIGYNKELECKETKNNDNIIGPNHYASDKGFEVFDVQEAFIHELKLGDETTIFQAFLQIASKHHGK